MGFLERAAPYNSLIAAFCDEVLVATPARAATVS